MNEITWPDQPLAESQEEFEVESIFWLDETLADLSESFVSENHKFN